MSPAARLALAPAILAALLGAPAPADAQVAGSLGASLVVSDGDLGGAAMLDVWAPIDVLRLGGFVGVSAIVSERDERNRVMMPVGASAGLFLGDEVVFSLRARGGIWGGATQETKLTIGAFLGGGLGLGFHVSPEVSVSAAVEVWGILGAGETWAIAPGLSLEWGHPVAPPEAAVDPEE